MRPRLQPFGVDLGNGAADGRYFQRDRQAADTLCAKRPERYRVADASDTETAAHRAVLAWMEETLARELPDVAPAAQASAVAERYATLAAAIQEDFVVQLRDPDGDDRAIAVYVSFPSGWRPELILNWSFHRIHEPVPDFADEEAPARSLVAAMMERGPYLRFVWTVCADDVLDHHADAPRSCFGPGASEGWLRIERQVTVPFPAEQASLFLIRTYLRPFSELDDAERADLATALRELPASTSRYKGLQDGVPHAIALLEAPR